MSRDVTSTSGTDRCPICDEPLDGGTTITSEGEAHEECAGFDGGADILPDGGTEQCVWCDSSNVSEATNRETVTVTCWDCGEAWSRKRTLQPGKQSQNSEDKA